MPKLQQVRGLGLGVWGSGLLNSSREFWKEGVKKHVALANVAATCYERLVSCMTMEQQEQIRLRSTARITLVSITVLTTTHRHRHPQQLPPPKP